MRQIMAADRGRPGFDPEAWLKSVHRACQGYTIYEADGRYVARGGGTIDERACWSSASSSTTARASPTRTSAPSAATSSPTS